LTHPSQIPGTPPARAYNDDLGNILALGVQNTNDPKGVIRHSFNFCNISGVLIKKVVKIALPFCANITILWNILVSITVTVGIEHPEQPTNPTLFHLCLGGRGALYIFL
jgi:hypothetical protein